MTEENASRNVNAGSYTHYRREVLGRRDDGSLILGERERLDEYERDDDG